VLKLVFVDMDDTFLTPEKTITPLNRQALDLAYERGIQFVPCTGRNYTGLPEELVSHPSVRYAVCCNGAIVRDLRENRNLHEVVMDYALVHDLWHQIQGLEVTFDLFADDGVFTARDRWHIIDEMDVSEATRYVVTSVRTCCDKTVDQMIDAAGSICRVNVFYLTEKDKRAVWEAVDQRPELTRASSLPCNVEITHAGADKGAGLTWLCNYLGISPKDTIAFGDSSNDIAMLRAAGDGVAMANAFPECLAAADHVTASCQDSGVARYLMGEGAPLFAGA
jgi:Cof subfamily protein (haloacid dehalogenase superfamily)